MATKEVWEQASERDYQVLQELDSDLEPTLPAPSRLTWEQMEATPTDRWEVADMEAVASLVQAEWLHPCKSLLLASRWEALVAWPAAQ